MTLHQRWSGELQSQPSKLVIPPDQPAATRRWEKPGKAWDHVERGRSAYPGPRPGAAQLEP